MRPLPVLSCIAALLLLSDVAAADCPAEPAGGVIHACANQRTGLLRCITAGESCRKNERLLTWNVDGSSGVRGTQGEPGPTASGDPLPPEGGAGVPVSGPSSTGAIRGQLTFCNGSAEDLDVYVPGTSFNAITDSAGRFVLSYVTIGVHDLKFRKNGVAVGGVATVQVLDAQLTDVGTVQLTDLATNQNCGTCGNTCTPPSNCIDGTCTLVCPSGTTPCEGTCATLTTDADNCGACGNACPAAPPNATRYCDKGTCSFRCTGTYEDCDGNAANGCEADLFSEFNCGTCGHECPPVPNGHMQCVFSCNQDILRPSCSVFCGGQLVCNAGYANCDFNTTNGCESLRTNVNCGGCGIRCAFNETCNGKGRCEPGTGGGK
jgi:hypothetical protein